MSNEATNSWVKKQGKEEMCELLFTAYLDSLFSSTKEPPFTRMEEHLCSAVPHILTGNNC